MSAILSIKANKKAHFEKRAFLDLFVDLLYSGGHLDQIAKGVGDNGNLSA